MASHRKQRTLSPLAARRRPLLLVLCLFTMFAFYAYRQPPSSLIEGLGWKAGGKVEPSPGVSSDHSLDLSDLDAPFVGWPLARVCRETVWTEGLVFLCDNNSGGIGNIRTAILTCLRYAIEAGATGLVLPRIRRRSDTDLSALFQEYRPFDYFFDEEHFRTGLTGHCPQITVYGDVHDILGVHEPDKFERITPKNQFGTRAGCDGRDLNRFADVFGVRFREWLDETSRKFFIPPIGLMNRRVIRPNWGVQFDWPVWHDGPEFVATYGGLLKFRRDILDLGRRTAALMREYARSLAHEEITSPDDDFVGIHLRTEEDALPAWPRFDNQTSAYLREASGRGFKAAYLATGNASEAEMFKARALRWGELHVVTKDDLLRGRSKEADYAALQALTWDQQALVDFVVLMESDYFMGMSPSSYSISVALKRHLKLEGLYTRPWKVGGSGDGRSWLVGSFERYWDDWLYFYETMWP